MKKYAICSATYHYHYMPINLHPQHDRSMNITIVAKGRCVKCFLFARRKEQLKDYIVSKQLYQRF